MRLPYPSDPTCRRLINAGKIAYTDIHLSNVAQHAWFGFLGHLDAISRQSFSSKTGPASRDKLAAENGAWWSLTWRMSSPPGERS
jgi:succinyl-CoA:acetate CoA-transferase